MLQDNIFEHGGSVAPPTKITYSALELAELYMTAREDFLGLDLEVVTNGWNLNYIFDFLYYIRKIELFDDIIEWLVECWKSKHQYYASYDKVSDNELKFNYYCFKEQLQLIKDKLLERFKSEKHTEELRKKMLAGYKKNSINTQPQQEAKPIVETPTAQPAFIQQSQTNELEYRMEDFDRNKLRCLLISDDKIFDKFVRLMRNDVWPFVCQNKGKYCNALRFVCMVHGIVAEKSTMPDFDNLLQAIIPDLPSQLSSMKQRQDANKKKNLINYRDPNKRRNTDCYKLANDCPDIEKKLQDVIDDMKKVTDS